MRREIVSKKIKQLAGFAAFMALAATFGIQAQGQSAPASQHTEAHEPVETAAPVKASPAIWKIKGAHGALYLLGTIHMMKPNVDWESAPVKTGLAASSKLVEEVSNVDDTTAAQTLLLQYGIDREHPLSTKIGKEDLAKLDAALQQMGIPGESALESLRPWAAMLTISILPVLKAGYTPESGVDMTLAQQWKATGKSVDGLETLDQQIHFFADMSEADQVMVLHVSLEQLDHASEDVDKIVTAWINGDVETIARLENTEFKQKYPGLYKLLIVERNKTWAEQLSRMLDSGGTEFVAVGAGHLPGNDGVLKLLAAKGYSIKRE